MTATILIAEDEAEIADTLTYALTTEGMTPIWVSQGGEALTILANQSIDLIVLDVGLPDCNGFELLKDIRKDYGLPVMMLTARSDEVDKIIGLEIGADDYVTKPFSPREVVARIKVILKRARGNTAATGCDPSLGTNADFRLDAAAMCLYYQDSVLDLTRSEFHLLSALVERPGQIFTRRQLIERVWSDNHPSDDRVIDTHVKSLRAKLHSVTPEHQPIITHRGFGYSIEAA